MTAIQLTEPHLIDCMARAAHEVNRAYCLALGDTSQLPYDEAPEWARESARKGVVAVVTALASGAEQRPEASHESWLAEKVATGWKYGPVKDPSKKEHPCMVPFDKLPPEQQAKDHLFVATVTKLAKHLSEV